MAFAATGSGDCIVGGGNSDYQCYCAGRISTVNYVDLKNITIYQYETKY